MLGLIKLLCVRVSLWRFSSVVTSQLWKAALTSPGSRPAVPEDLPRALSSAFTPVDSFRTPVLCVQQVPVHFRFRAGFKRTRSTHEVNTTVNTSSLKHEHNFQLVQARAGSVCRHLSDPVDGVLHTHLWWRHTCPGQSTQKSTSEEQHVWKLTT